MSDNRSENRNLREVDKGFKTLLGDEQYQETIGLVGRPDKFRTQEMKEADEGSVLIKERLGIDQEAIAIKGSVSTDLQKETHEQIAREIQQREARMKEEIKKYGKEGEAAIRNLRRAAQFATIDRFERTYLEGMNSLKGAPLNRTQEMNTLLEIEDILKGYHNSLPKDGGQEWTYDLVSAHEQKVNAAMNKRGRNPAEWLAKIFNRSR
jgi:hypothetical protein